MRGARSRGGRRGAREGQALLWTAVLLPFFLALVGLAIDGATVFAARRSCQAVADGAARAGAMELDIATYRQSDGDTEGEALGKANTYCYNQGAAYVWTHHEVQLTRRIWKR